jgi:phosphoenolpyruvate carboxykinase (ATP)
MPEKCPGVPSEILNPQSTWKDQEAYKQAARKLAHHFIENFEQYRNYVNGEIIAAAPFY